MSDSAGEKVPLFLFTYNCGKGIPLSSEFAASISKLYDTSKEPAHFYVFGFQELSSVLDGTLPELINSVTIQLSDLLVDSLLSAYGNDCNFQTVAITHIGTIALILISPFKSRITHVKTASLPCGYYMTSVKGGCGVRVSYNKFPGVQDSEPVEFTFVVAHLNANEGYQYVQRRNQDLLRLFQGLDFEDGSSIIKKGSHCFFMGDLNYRTKSLVELVDEYESGNYSDHVTQRDELIERRSQGEVFWGFDEADIKFNPTYKFTPGTLRYNYKRLPSWCDRILFQSYNRNYEEDRFPDSNPKPIIHEYKSASDILYSDHIPVYLSIDVPLQPPAALVSDSGYLIEQYGLVGGDIYLKPTKVTKYIKTLGTVTDFLLGYTLFLGTTTRGRICLAIILVATYLLYRFL